jgi:hypothetical protein
LATHRGWRQWIEHCVSSVGAFFCCRVFASRDGSLEEFSKGRSIAAAFRVITTKARSLFRAPASADSLFRFTSFLRVAWYLSKKCWAPRELDRESENDLKAARQRRYFVCLSLFLCFLLWLASFVALHLLLARCRFTSAIRLLSSHSNNTQETTRAVFWIPYKLFCLCLIEATFLHQKVLEICFTNRWSSSQICDLRSSNCNLKG